MKTILEAAQQAIAELERLHDIIEPCEKPDCPTRKAIEALREAIKDNEGQALVVWTISTKARAPRTDGFAYLAPKFESVEPEP